MDWIFDKLPVLIFVIIAVFQIARAVLKSRDAQAEHEQGHDESEEQRRVREIQERIRRTIAARRGQATGESAGPTAHPNEPMTLPPVLRPEPVASDEPYADPFHGAPATPPPPVPAAVLREARSLELERQVELADKMRELADAQAVTKRRAAHLAEAEMAVARSETGTRSARRLLLNDLIRDPESLRRAFVLREILGPPVGMRK